MSKKALTEDEIKDIYFNIVSILRYVATFEDKKYLSADKLCEEIGQNKSRISTAIKWARREFSAGKSNIVNQSNYVMSSPKGYFLPADIKEAMAFTLSFYKDALSRKKTISPMYGYLKEHYPDDFRMALNAIDQSFDEEEGFDEYEPKITVMKPWGVYDAIMGNK